MDLRRGFHSIFFSFIASKIFPRTPITGILLDARMPIKKLHLGLTIQKNHSAKCIITFIVAKSKLGSASGHSADRKGTCISPLPSYIVTCQNTTILKNKLCRTAHDREEIFLIFQSNL